jgi:hypothetical protein
VNNFGGVANLEGSRLHMRLAVEKVQMGVLKGLARTPLAIFFQLKTLPMRQHK